MTSIVIFGVAVLGSILIVAFAMTRSRAGASMRPQLRNAARFVGGPFSISIAIHVAILFTLIIAVHESRAREHLIAIWTPGTDRALEGAEELVFPEPTFDFSTHSRDDSAQAIDVDR